MQTCIAACHVHLFNTGYKQCCVRMVSKKQFTAALLTSDL